MKVMNVDITPMSVVDFEKKLEAMLLGGSRCKVGKINTEFLHRAVKNEEFAETLNSFDLNIPDGRGVLWAARFLTLPVSDNRITRSVQAIWQMIYSGAAIVLNPKFITYPIKKNIPGVDALKLMLQAAEKAGREVFIFGATEVDLQPAVTALKQGMADLIIAGQLNGYDYQNDNSISPVEIINKTKAELLIVALGSPRQEYWIRDNISKLNNIKAAVGEGGSLAFIAGTQRRAPKWMQRIGLEWLWRLFANKSMTQTGSRFRRVWNAVPAFIYDIVKWKIRYGKTEL